MRGPGPHPTSLVLQSETSSAWASCFSLLRGLHLKVALRGSSHRLCGLHCSPKSCKFRFRQQHCSMCRRQSNTSSFAQHFARQRTFSTPLFLFECFSKRGRCHRVSGLESGCLAKSCKNSKRSSRICPHSHQGLLGSSTDSLGILAQASAR